jgi:Sugar (pentulose and hexulose) kinases
MPSAMFIAVDLGAGSGRVFLAGIGENELSLEEVRRFHYPPRLKHGRLRWDFRVIFDEIKTGLKQASGRARELDRPVRSIGIDSWAVDYGLLDGDSNLIDDPVCYRDDRTSGAMKKVFERVPRFSIFEKTGIQFQSFNTLFQLWSEGENVDTASKLLLLPDLINYFLTGKLASEFTNATTTQMVNNSSGTWDIDLLDRLDIPARILPDIIPAGSDLGRLKPEISAEIGLYETRVIATASHDTASAVAAAPMSSECAYISSGTWSLIGVENNSALINEEVERQNFTNEGGVYGTTRFLKNVMGLWIFESCRREWRDRGIDLEYEVIVNEASRRSGFPALIFPDDRRFLNPPSMLEALKQQMQETEEEFAEDPISIAKMIFDSLAFRYASVLGSIESLTRRKLAHIQILGGGGRNRYLNQMAANASGLTVKAGLYEATVVGNVLVQAISTGHFASLTDARKHVADNVAFLEFSPQISDALADAAARYREIESRFLISY